MSFKSMAPRPLGVASQEALRRLDGSSEALLAGSASQGLLAVSVGIAATEAVKALNLPPAERGSAELAAQIRIVAAGAPEWAPASLPQDSFEVDLPLSVSHRLVSC